MSKATKVKHVQKEVLEEFNLPEFPQQVVKVLSSRGNNLHEVETDKGERFLASMPTKFRRNVWVKRGNFVIIEPIEEGDKVKAEITQILYKEQIKYIKAEKKWPSGFDDISKDTMTEKGDAGHSDDDLFVNTNRVTAAYEESEDDSSGDEISDEEEEDNNSGNASDSVE